MQKITHITMGYTAVLGTSYFILNSNLDNIAFSNICIILLQITSMVPLLAILPDADHGQDSLSKKGLKLPGKHRGRSHSLYGILLLSSIVITLFHFLNIYTFNINFISILKYIVILIVLMMLFSFMLYFLKKIPILGNIIKSISGFIIIISIGLLSYTIFLQPLHGQYSSEFLGNIAFLLIFFIMFSHLIGDFLTKNGVPLLFPFNSNKFNSVITATTGKFSENLYRILFMGINIILLYNLYNIISNSSLNIDKLHNSGGNITLFIVSSIILLYFFGKELNFKKKYRILKKFVISTIIFIILLSLLILLFINSLFPTYLLLLLFLILIIIYIIYLYKKIDNISSLFIFILIILIQFGLLYIII